MRALLAATAAVLVTSLATPAFSQHADGFGRAVAGSSGKRGADGQQPARNERAYKSALDRIPDAANKYDPWGRVRQQSPAGTTPAK
jgi:hypothetical protein